jgi:hypothetical protein
VKRIPTAGDLVKFLESLPDTVIIEIDSTRLIVVLAVFEGLGVSVVDLACNLVTSTLETRRYAWIGACIVEISTIRRANLRAARLDRIDPLLNRFCTAPQVKGCTISSFKVRTAA